MKSTSLLTLLLVAVLVMVDVYTRQQVLQSLATTRDQLAAVQATVDASSETVQDQARELRSIDRSTSGLDSKLDDVTRRLDQLDMTVQSNAP